MIVGGLRTNFHAFYCPGDWLEIRWLFRVILGSPQILRPSGLKVNGSSPGSSNTIQDACNLTLEILRPRLGILRLRSGYIGYMVHWKPDYTIIPRSVVAPTRGAGGLIQECPYYSCRCCIHRLNNWLWKTWRNLILMFHRFRWMFTPLFLTSIALLLV